ncbi:MAG: hypothetical protein AB7O45_01880 [Alphaproteobacteria bacterium]
MLGETLARGLLADGPAVAASPFPHVVCRPALPEGDYRRLAEAFPPMARIAGPPPHPNNEAFRVGAATLLASRKLPAVWRDFVAHHVSPAFWSDIVRVLGDAIRVLHPTVEARIGRPLDQWRVGCRRRDQGTDVLLDCQLVVNTPVTAETTVRGAHIDTPDKIVSGLYYFRPDDDATPGGDLDLYRWRGPPRFYELFAPHDAVERVATVPYAANCFLAFVNAPVSVHGVSRRAVSDRPRFYVNFIAELPFDLFQVPQVPGWRPAPDDREAPSGGT